MKIFYGWVIVGAGIVVTCVGFGAMFSLGVFLQPMSETMGWSRTGLSTAALLNFLCMGVGSFAWGGLSDRLGTRRRAPWRHPARPRHGDGEPGAHPCAIPGLLRHGRRLRGRQPVRADDGDDHPLVHAAPQSRGRAGLGGARARLDDDGAPGALAHHHLRLAHGHARDRRSGLALHHSSCIAGAGAAGAVSWKSCRGDGRRRQPRVHGGAGAAHAAVRRHRVHVLRVLRGALGPDLPHGHPRDRPRRAWPR
jgi:hypothetical protein